MARKKAANPSRLAAIVDASMRSGRDGPEKPASAAPMRVEVRSFNEVRARWPGKTIKSMHIVLGVALASMRSGRDGPEKQAKRLLAGALIRRRFNEVRARWPGKTPSRPTP